MKSFTRKSIVSTILIGSVVAGSAFTTLPFTKELNPVASAASSSFTQFLHDNAPGRTIKTSSSGLATVTNLSSTVVLVNKKRNLPSTYAPQDLVVPNIPFSFSGSSPKKQMRKVAATAIENLFAAAKKTALISKPCPVIALMLPKNPFLTVMQVSKAKPLRIKPVLVLDKVNIRRVLRWISPVHQRDMICNKALETPRKANG